MACLDYEIGRLLKELKKRKLYDDTLIVITSDHGELLGEHEDIGHSFWLYQELLHVPLIVKYPQQRMAGQVRKNAVQNSDIFAEILEQAGIEMPPDIVGQPLARVDHMIFSEMKCNDTNWGQKWPNRYKYNLQAIYSKVFNHFKLIHSDAGEDELYDIGTDSKEMLNLLDPIKKIIIQDELNKYLSTLNPLHVAYLKKQPNWQNQLDPA
jgi:arylsulfatase A-like enzyme